MGERARRRRRGQRWGRTGLTRHRPPCLPEDPAGHGRTRTLTWLSGGGPPGAAAARGGHRRRHGGLRDRDAGSRGRSLKTPRPFPLAPAPRPSALPSAPPTPVDPRLPRRPDPAPPKGRAPAPLQQGPGFPPAAPLSPPPAAAHQSQQRPRAAPLPGGTTVQRQGGPDGRPAPRGTPTHNSIRAPPLRWSCPKPECDFAGNLGRPPDSVRGPATTGRA